ncbi:radical SAM family heme chaperone HemW [Neptuniibacter sp. CAU 1671]|uniref:radical SAM family heme chaperone HemW n=1 Tax=Neptuniibacter sp. CAU 1671 TaxID=3032593 RepID=UPI0023D97BBC|nr:radical SAM family heme chaperone HemW [Neptuniibacter sp. CAU 1671]MDF2182395.1 radical SAM family heme chaperone HemW [Neptuniibacter sp. CAU 1671]
MTLQLPPLSLYVHIPWCVRKCPYCDFNSHAVRNEIPEQAYIECLLEDLKQEAQWLQGRTIQSIFFGGGTPSLFSADSYKKLLADIHRITPLAVDAEITLEANPGTFEQEKFRGFREAGINRLSLGIQSFSDHQLQALGRIHNAEEALHAAGLAREIFPRLNLDLMHGLPDQNVEGALADLEQALSINPDHLSWYQLTIEPNTEFHARPPQLPVDETLWSIQEAGQARLADAGLQQYEISAYSQPGQEARHNLNYWQFGDYIGIGAGAHGKLTLPEEGRIIRRWKQKQPKAYMQTETRLGGESDIATEDRAFEFMLNVLRLTEGVDATLLTARTGLEPEQIAEQLETARKRGLLLNNPERLAPSQQGRLFLNDLLGLFLN